MIPKKEETRLARFRVSQKYKRKVESTLVKLMSFLRFMEYYYVLSNNRREKAITAPLGRCLWSF